MNDRIKELFEQVADNLDPEDCMVSEEFLEAFSELIVRDYARQLVQSNMSNPEYAQAMDAYYEQKWAHRFD